jgi:hypothetical protein
MSKNTQRLVGISLTMAQRSALEAIAVRYSYGTCGKLMKELAIGVIEGRVTLNAPVEKYGEFNPGESK